MKFSAKKILLSVLIGIVLLFLYGLNEGRRFIHEAQKEKFQNLKARTSEFILKEEPSHREKSPEQVFKKVDVSTDNEKSSAEFDPREEVPYEERPLIDSCHHFERVVRNEKGNPQKVSPRLPRLFVTSITMGPLLLEQRIPALREIDQEIYRDSVHVGDDEFSNLMSSFDFMKKQFEIKSELEAHLSEAQELQVRSYYIWVLAQIAAKAPGPLFDGTVAKLCERFENLDQNVSQNEMNEEIKRLLYIAQLSESDIDWNPRFKSRLTVKWGRDGFRYSNGAGPKGF